MSDEIKNLFQTAILEGEALKEQEFAIRKDKANSSYSELLRRKEQQSAFDEMTFGEDVEKRAEILTKENRAYLKLAQKAQPFLGLEEFKDKLSIFPRNIILFAARTGTGKSTTCANIALHAILQGQKILILTNEEVDTDILNRIIFLMNGWSYAHHNEVTEEQQLECDRLYPILMERVEIVNDMRNNIGGTTTTLEGIKGVCLKLSKEYKAGKTPYNAIILDYVQNVRTSLENPRLEQWGVLSRLLAFFDNWKAQYPAPILLFSQLKASSKDDPDIKNRIEGFKAIMNSCTAVIEVIADFENLRTEWKFAKNRFKGSVGTSVFTGYERGKYIKYDQKFMTEVRLKNDRKNHSELMSGVLTKGS